MKKKFIAITCFYLMGLPLHHLYLFKNLMNMPFVIEESANKIGFGSLKSFNKNSNFIDNSLFYEFEGIVQYSGYNNIIILAGMNFLDVSLGSFKYALLKRGNFGLGYFYDYQSYNFRWLFIVNVEKDNLCLLGKGSVQKKIAPGILYGDLNVLFVGNGCDTIFTKLLYNNNNSFNWVMVSVGLFDHITYNNRKFKWDLWGSIHLTNEPFLQINAAISMLI